LKIAFRPLAIASLLLSLVLGVGVAFADDTSDHDDDSTLERIDRTGVMRVGVSATQPPFSMKTKSGDVIGFDVDLATALAAAMEVKVEIVVMDFAELIPAVEDYRVDIALSGMTMTAARNRRVAFAGPYFASGKGVLTKSATLAQADDPDDLKGSHTIVALDGSTSMQIIEALGSDVKAVAVKDYATGVKQVIDGKADALVADYPILIVALLQNPDKGLESILSPFTFEPIGAAINGDDDDSLFVNLVQNYFNTLEGTGLMGALRGKWFDSGEWLALIE
jgi:polar amino acid transport system substrate-binding protein